MLFRSICLHSVTLFMLITLALTPMWLRHPYAAPAFSWHYPTGFYAFSSAALTVAFWSLSGFHGLTDVWRDRPKRIAVITAALIAVWALLTVPLAFTWERERPSVAMGAAFQLVTAISFAIAVTTARVNLRAIAWTLAIVALLNAFVGFGQVTLQDEIGLVWLGEFTFNVQEGGTSVVQSGDVRWLRPYGLTSHPNIYAGFLVVGLCAAGSLIFATQSRWGWLALGIFCVVLWTLFLTFSRAAWLGFVGGSVGFLVLNGRQIIKDTHHRKRLYALVSSVLILGITFLWLFRPFIFARAGIGTEAVEVRSVGERVMFTRVALIAIEENPLRGVGAGNFPWFASYYFFDEGMDWRGDNVHSIYLTAQAELGAVGTILFAGVILITIGIGGKRLLTQPDMIRSAFWCSVVAWLIIGLFDHYPWTLFPSQLLFWVMIQMSLSLHTEY